MGIADIEAQPVQQQIKMYPPGQRQVCFMYSKESTDSLLYQAMTETLRGDKVSMLSHIYPHKPLRKIELTVCNHQADSPLYVWLNV